MDQEAISTGSPQPLRARLADPAGPAPDPNTAPLPALALALTKAAAAALAQRAGVPFSGGGAEVTGGGCFFERSDRPAAAAAASDGDPCSRDEIHRRRPPPHATRYAAGGPLPRGESLVPHAVRHRRSPFPDSQLQASRM